MASTVANGTSVKDNPLLLAVVLFYSTVLGLPLSFFPPTHWPITVVDVLTLATIVLCAVRIALTFAYAASGSSYSAKLFAVEVGTAVILAYQFRVLAAMTTRATVGEAVLFYVLQALLIGTMVFWTRVTGDNRWSQAIQWLRALAGVTVALGIAAEMVDEDQLRWVAALLLAFLSIYYAWSRPWSSLAR